MCPQGNRGCRTQLARAQPHDARRGQHVQTGSLLRGTSFDGQAHVRQRKKKVIRFLSLPSLFLALQLPPLSVPTKGSGLFPPCFSDPRFPIPSPACVADCTAPNLRSGEASGGRTFSSFLRGKDFFRDGGFFFPLRNFGGLLVVVVLFLYFWWCWFENWMVYWLGGYCQIWEFASRGVANYGSGLIGLRLVALVQLFIEFLMVALFRNRCCCCVPVYNHVACSISS